MNQRTFLKRVGMIFGTLLLLGGCTWFGAQPQGQPGTSAEQQVMREMQAKIQDREMKSGNVTGKVSLDLKGKESGKFTISVDSDFDVAKKGDEKVKLTLAAEGEMNAQGVSGKGNAKLDFDVFPKTIYLNLGEIKVDSDKDPTLKQTVDMMISPYVGQWWKMDLPEGVNPFETTSAQNSNVTPDQEAKIKELVKKSDFFTVDKNYGNEKINGVDTYHYGIKLNEDGMVNFAKETAKIMEKPMSADDEKKMREGLKKMKLEGELWIGVQDKYIYKTNLTVAAKDEEQNMDMNFKFELTLDPNKSVSITEPSGAQDLMTALAPLMMGPGAVPGGSTETPTYPEFDNSNFNFNDLDMNALPDNVDLNSLEDLNLNPGE